jgi:hypothetical protein
MIKIGDWVSVDGFDGSFRVVSFQGSACVRVSDGCGDVLVARLSRCHGGPAREAGGALSRLADGAAAAFNREG